MSELHDKIEEIRSNESFLEKIKRWIPGYDGYVNRDNSRELDTMLRNKLAQMLEVNKTKIKNTTLNLSKNGKLFLTSDIEKIDKKNELIIGKFKTASRGYSGAFDVKKIKEEELNKLYEFDMNMLNDAGKINRMFEELETMSEANNDISVNVKQISACQDSILQSFDEREMILKA
ncbi:hypothetical protein BH10BAC5_BH10BAC5_08930 [soil metagenome]